MEEDEAGEDEMNEEEGEDELEEMPNADEKGDLQGNVDMKQRLSRIKSVQLLRKQMSIQSVHAGVIGEDGGVEGGDDDESSMDGMRTRQ